MASVQEYLEKQSTAVLHNLLTLESYGAEQCTLNAIYHICKILAKREPELGNARERFQEFARLYAEHMDLAER